MTIIIDTAADLTLENCRLASWQGEAVTFSTGAMVRMEKARAYFLSLLDDPDITIYGVNTGYGHRAKHRLDASQRKAQAKAPTHHRAASWGDNLPDRVTRAIVFARLANFVGGHAAVSPPLAVAVASMLDGRPLPQIPARGQGGAGEILSLSYLFMDLAGTFPLAEKDLLTLVNGSPAATALVADAALSAMPRLEVAVEALALAAEAFLSPHGHFAEELEACWNNAHDAWALQRLRSLMAGGDTAPRRPYQAPVSIRILPRVLGQAHRAAETAIEVARQSLAAVSDNPVVIPPEARIGADRVISTGGYHNMQAAAALDGLVCAYANIAVLAGRIASKLQDSSVSLLPQFLGHEDGRSYLGCIPMAMVGYEEEMRMLAQPTLLPGSESGGYGQDDVASPVFLAWSKHDKAATLLNQSLASLAGVARRAFIVTNRGVPPALKALARDVDQCFPDNNESIPFGSDIAKLAESFNTRIFKA